MLWGAFSSCSEQRYVGFALQRLLLLWSMGSGLMGSVVGAHGECWIQLLQCGTDHYPDLKSPLIKTRKHGSSFFFLLSENHRFSHLIDHGPTSETRLSHFSLSPFPKQEPLASCLSFSFILLKTLNMKSPLLTNFFFNFIFLNFKFYIEV